MKAPSFAPAFRFRRCFSPIRSPLRLGLLLALTLASASAAPTDDAYKLGPDSMPQAGVPEGKVTEWAKLPSEIFPGTFHDYCVYVPAQYDPAKPASLMVFQDGQAFHRLTGDYRVPHVLDNLIYRREIPVMLAVFINPARTNEQPMASASAWGDGAISSRGLEYNALDDKYAKVLVDELLPVLSKQYNISKNPEDRGIGGASSGAIAAFTVAWHRPDQFRKVLSTIGSYTNIRGGHVYPDLVRQSEKKPIRIFLQDGMSDNRGVGRGGGRGARGGNNAAAATPPVPATANAGATPAAAAPAPADPAAPAVPAYNAERDWYTQNRKMVAALTEKGYDVNYVWGIGTHNNKHGGAILPEMLRWLWRDYPRPPDDPRDATNRGFLVPAGYVAPAAAPAAPATPASGAKQ